MSLNNNLRVACMQLNSSDCIEENLDTIAKLLDDHQQQNNQLILLPENAVLLTNNLSLKQQAVTAETNHRIFAFFSQQAKQYNTWLIAGSLLVPDPENPDKFLNHCPVFSPDGTHTNSYNKMHLFDADLKTESWHESTLITAGKSPVRVALDNDWKVGLSTCYDLRFPELYREYSNQGCNIMTVPAAFTVPTGKAHWEPLLRARAIENQSFILAAGQSGQHADGRHTYGHSMIIDPWGEILNIIEHGIGMISATLSLEKLEDIQRHMPVLKHRRLK